MKLIIIFGILLLIGIGLKIWDNFSMQFFAWRGFIGDVLLIFTILPLIISSLCWITREKDSQIRYEKLIQEKITIEEIMDTEPDISKALLNDRIIEYNNKVIEIKINSKRPILEDYYSKNIDWDSLEFIKNGKNK